MPDEATDRQRKLVEILTSGQRCSLNRALRLSGYGKHNASLEQILRSDTIIQLFADAVAKSRPLPPAAAARIMAKIAEHDLDALR